MNFVEFKNSLRDFPVFSIADIRAAHSGFDRRRLSEWQKKGYIKKIIKGFYLFSDLDIDESTLLAVANKIYKPSYISLETAMSYYRLIPESIYLITSASTRRTSLFETPMARFSYRTIKPSLFFGYSLLTGGIKMAFVEKAILDYLYINPAIRTADDFASLRINREEMLSRVSMARLTVYLQRFNHKRLAKTMKHFLGWLDPTRTSRN
jgi:predicted transcriptional regulator of viral defense system